MKSKLVVIVVSTALSLSLTMMKAHAVACTETVINLIVHSSGNVYFQTNATCGNWCQINWSTEAANKNGYAMLLTAKTTGKTLTFVWPNLSACNVSNVTYASPDYIILGSQ